MERGGGPLEVAQKAGLSRRPGLRPQELDGSCQKHHQDRADEQVGGGPGQGYQHVIALGITELAYVHRGRLGPAEDGCASQEEQEREQQAADGIDVPQRVERDTPELGGRVIAAEGGDPRVRRLVHGDRQQQDQNLDSTAEDQVLINTHIRVRYELIRAETSAIRRWFRASTPCSIQSVLTWATIATK